MAKKILILASAKPVEALRMAAGLTLADAELQVLSLGPLPEGEDAQSQLEALAFADITPLALRPDQPDCWTTLAQAMARSDAVYVV